MNGLYQRVTLYLKMIKFSHSIFALPFAFTAAVMAASGLPPVRDIFWIVIAMAGARSGAMGFNRIIDREIDARNPRTTNREIPAGKIDLKSAVFFTLISFLIFIAAAYMLNPLCLRLSPLAIAIVVIYSYTKRYTWASHFVLGLALSVAPIGAWIAVKGIINIEILPLSLAVVFWLAGFDTLYALQDVEFDKTAGLYSIPQRFGVRKAIYLARLFHLITVLLLVFTGIIMHMGTYYLSGMAIVAALFIYEHSLVTPRDLSRLNMAFFNMNGYISVTVFVFTLLDYSLT